MKKLIRLLIVLVFIPAILCPMTALADEAEEKKEVTITFLSMGGTECEAITGIAGETKITDDMLPTPTKEGYVFLGWRHFNAHGAPFELEVFPNYDIRLVADFEPLGFLVDFEGSVIGTYDHNSGIELHGVKSEQYNAEFIRSGWNSLRTIKGKENPMFLLSYYDKLEVGKEYELSVWLETENGKARGNVELVYFNNPDVRDESLGSQWAFNISDIKCGEWCKYTVKFVAAAPYMAMRMPNVDDIYIEDVYVEKTGKTAKPPELNKEGNSPLLIIMLFGAVVLITAASIVIDKMNKKKKQC